MESLIIVRNTAKVRKMAIANPIFSPDSMGTTKQNKFKTDRIMTGKIVEIIT